MTEIPDLRTDTEVEPEHDEGYDADVSDVDELEPDFTAEETEEVDEVVQDEEADA